MTLSVSGSLAALSAPCLMVIGLAFYDKYWKKSKGGHPFVLNLFKCSLVTIALLLSVLAVNGYPWPEIDSDGTSNLLYLLLSGLIGITIGDCCWLLALSYLGTRKVILIDIIKPYAGALLAVFILDESWKWTNALAMTVTLLGIGIVCTRSSDQLIPAKYEKRDPEQALDKDDSRNPCRCDGPGNESERKRCDNENDSIHNTEEKSENETSAITAAACSEDPNMSNSVGYAWSTLNVLFDVYASVLTKQYGTGFTAWDISLLRFGSAACSLALCFCVLSLHASHEGSHPPTYSPDLLTRDTKTPQEYSDKEPQSEDHFKSQEIELEPTNQTLFGNDDPCYPHIEHDASTLSQDSNKTVAEFKLTSSRSASAIPKLTKFEWLYLCVGVFFATYIPPLLMNYAIFELPLSTFLSFTALAPIYALPVTYFTKGEAIALRSFTGSVIAVIGVILLYQL